MRTLIAFFLKYAKLFTGGLLVKLVQFVWGLFLKLIKVVTRRRAIPLHSLGRC